MEISGLYALGSAVGAVAGSPATSAIFDAVGDWWRRRKLRHRVRALVLMKGNSTLCEKLTTTNCVFIDCDKLLQNLTIPVDAETAAKQVKPDEPNPVDKLLVYSIVKRHIINICSVWKDRIVLVSKHLDLLQMLPVQHRHIHFCAFSKDAERNLGVIFSSEKEHAESQLQKFRIIQELPETQVFVVDSLKDAYDAVKVKFDCKKSAL
jgi:hypothetical protein